MAEELGSLVTVLVHSILSFIAAFLSFQIYLFVRKTPRAVSWLAFTWAFALVFTRRMIEIGIDYGFFTDMVFRKLEGILLIIISGLYIWGLLVLKREYESKRSK